MSSSISTDLASCLINTGNSIAVLLRDGKNEAKVDENSHIKLGRIINDMMDALKKEEGLATLFPAEESMGKILEKVEWSLQEFKRIDPNNASRYNDLGKIIYKFKSPSQKFAIVSAFQGSNVPTPVSNNSKDVKFDDEFKKLNVDEQSCLYCFTLLPHKARIIKRNLIHWCIGLEYNLNKNEDVVNVDEIFSKLVEKRLVEPISPPTIRNKKLANRYKMHHVNHSTLREKTNLDFKSCKMNDMSVMHIKANRSPENIVALVNIHGSTLNSKAFDWVSNMKKLKVLHLGHWDDDPTKYVVVEDVGALTKALKQVRDVRYLSLEGVSGILELPESVYELKKLIVLNLRGCQNLEYLPQGIESLSRLIYLDLSECYLLDHVPKGIAFLSNLEVLKGFIIPANEEQIVSKPNKKTNLQKCALLSDIIKLEKLHKLTLRARSMKFPTITDFEMLYEMKSLKSLKITWVGASLESSGSFNVETSNSTTLKLPPNLVKLEIEAASKDTTSQLLKLISEKEEQPLKNLYIKGGGFEDLFPNKDLKVLRLQFLPKLQASCYEMIHMYPNLHRLEMSLDIMYSLLHRSFKMVTGQKESVASWRQCYTSHV